MYFQPNVINEIDPDAALRFNHRNKNLLLFDDNGNCRVNHKHHHSAKNLSNSQLNSATNTNSRNVSGEYGASDDFEEERDSGSARVAANIGECQQDPKQPPPPENDVFGGKRNSFYCISLGNMMTVPSQSSINYVSARPSFYSDPTRQCDYDGDLKT